MDTTFQEETEQIRRLAGRVSGLPALPIITTRLCEAVDDPNTSASDLALLISSDPALATKLLKLANSAYYGFPRRIGTVNLAVVVLGFETVRDLSLSVIITDCFFNVGSEMPFEMAEFWSHSLATAVAARMVYRTCDASHPGEGFIAGLVHDIGKLFLAKYFPETYAQVIHRVKQEEFPLLDAEKEIFSVTHPVAGAWLLEEWNLPLWLVDSTLNHHGKDGSEELGRLAQAVRFADLLVRMACFEGGGCSVETAVTPEMMESLKLKKNAHGEPDYDAYLGKLQQELQRAQGLMDTIRKPGLT